MQTDGDLQGSCKARRQIDPRKNTKCDQRDAEFVYVFDLRLEEKQFTPKCHCDPRPEHASGLAQPELIENKGIFKSLLSEMFVSIRGREVPC